MATAIALSLQRPEKASSLWKSYGPAVAALGLYAAITASLQIAAFRAAEGHFVYPVDDTYIAMAMARSLALHGVWGITQYAFTSSSSSPLFTLLLALAYRLTGVHETTAFLLSWTGGILAIWQADRFLGEYLNAAWRSAALAIVVLASPLFATGVLGMEHTLHLALAFAFLREFQKGIPSARRLFVLAALMVGARYESLFLLGAAAAFLAIQRRWRLALASAGGAAFAISAYGLFALRHRSYFLPNSVALKGNTIHGGTAPLAIALRFLWTPVLTLPVLALIFGAIALRRSRQRIAQIAGLVAVAGCGQIAFATYAGAPFRYEAYFIALACAILALVFVNWPVSAIRLRPLFQAALFFGGIFLTVRSITAATGYPGYSRAIWHQQMQSARFLRTFFPNASIAANDIGAISFFTDIHCTDLVGLADSRIFSAKHSGTFTTRILSAEAAATGVQIAIVYDSWFTGKTRTFWIGPPLPAEWKRVAKLSVPSSEAANRGGVLGDDTVSFYAVDPSKEDDLRAALLQFEPSLPSADRLVFEH